MTCQDVQRVLPQIMDGGQNREFQTHLQTCPACSELVSDLELIASEARQLAATEEPAPRVWVRIAAELRSEGLIREPEPQPARPVLVPAEGRRWNAWWLLPVAAALLVAGSYRVSHKPATPIAVSPTVVAPASKNAPDVSAQAVDQKRAPQVAEQKRPTVLDRAQDESAFSAPMETVSTEDQQFLDDVGQRAPRMKAAYESQLRAVNSYIRDAEAYLKRNPGDEDARQQLMDAYQQKAMLYQMALDHIQ
jgi:hypothetical protein